MARALMTIEFWAADDAGRDRTQSWTGGPPHRKHVWRPPHHNGACRVGRAENLWSRRKWSDLKTTLRRHDGGRKTDTEKCARQVTGKSLVEDMLGSDPCL